MFPADPLNYNFKLRSGPESKLRGRGAIRGIHPSSAATPNAD